jgi:hypothetical protein
VFTHTRNSSHNNAEITRRGGWPTLALAMSLISPHEDADTLNRAFPMAERIGASIRFRFLFSRNQAARVRARHARPTLLKLISATVCADAVVKKIISAAASSRTPS